MGDTFRIASHVFIECAVNPWTWIDITSNVRMMSDGNDYMLETQRGETRVLSRLPGKDIRAERFYQQTYYPGQEFALTFVGFSS